MDRRMVRTLRTSAREEWDFLTMFEQQYGTFHPFFMSARKFKEVVTMSEDDHKMIFVYLHVPDHPSVSSFCRQTLCCEPVVEFLDENLVSWGTIANNNRLGEGYRLASILQPASFPFCAIVSPASADNLTVIQRIEGSVSPDELVEILKRTMEEQLDPGFGAGRAKKKAERRLREDIHGSTTRLSTLRIDQEKDKGKERKGRRIINIFHSHKRS
ncbi:plant UBX domain-containing protein 10-like [Impatiens glandulifera]|uniref:plant UBX domain-containing protein 10-like n=1 Tax=Impatiens glandulifera TaxID=253017 RepID=UPI001FB07C0D|nr:plant UBX domain-containing protein 10-like [Impatiens glandulifera]